MCRHPSLFINFDIVRLEPFTLTLSEGTVLVRSNFLQAKSFKCHQRQTQDLTLIFISSFEYKNYIEYNNNIEYNNYIELFNI